MPVRSSGLRVIMLDIDGVLCLLENNDARSFSSRCVDQLNRILRECPDVKLVISSTWRLLYPLHQLQDQFVDQGLSYPERIIGHTPLLDSRVRGEEIAQWLAGHPEVTDFVIIDDDSDMGKLLDRLFQTNFKNGLTPEIADSIIARFQKQFVSQKLGDCADNIKKAIVSIFRRLLK